MILSSCRGDGAGRYIFGAAFSPSDTSRVPRASPGRPQGVSYHIQGDGLSPIPANLNAMPWPPSRAPTKNWYRVGIDREHGTREFIVQDPDGYRLRFTQTIGGRAGG